MKQFYTDDIKDHIWDSVRSCVMKFREQPDYFFTESDIISYLYHKIYTTKLEKTTKNGKKIYLVHREYPTNFRYVKKDMLSLEEPLPLNQKMGNRGHYDMVVLNPSYIENKKVSYEDIVNKNVRDLENRTLINEYSMQDELLFALEFKYIIANSKSYINGIKEDIRKLQYSHNRGVVEAINLVFCNTNDNKTVTEVKDIIASTNGFIYTAFIQAYFHNGQKQSPKVIKNQRMSQINIF